MPYSLRTRAAAASTLRSSVGSMWMKVTSSSRAASVPRCEDQTAQARALAALSSVAMARPAPLSRTAAARYRVEIRHVLAW